MQSIQDFVRYAPVTTRPKVQWPHGKRLAFWIVPNVEFYEYTPPPARGRETWDRVPSHPDVREYGFRDYGNRVGIWRMTELLDQYPVRPTASLNLALLDHFPEIAQLIRERGWAVMSHGIYNTRFLYGMDEAQERAFYADNVASLLRHTGQRLQGILTPAITNTSRTPALIAEAGLSYHADWVHDDVPVPILVPGRRLVSMPYSYDLNDAPLWDGRPYGGRYFVDACKAAFDRLYTESADGGRVFCIALHPYQIGQPHHIGHLREILDHVCAHSGVWHATGDEIAAHFLQHDYDAHVQHAAEVAVQAAAVAAARPAVVVRARATTPVRGGPVPADRRTGMDHPHYPWSPLPLRTPLRWPGDRGLAVVPLINLETVEDPLPTGWPQIHSVGGGLIRDFPNISRVSTREYGHRVGIFRLVEALRKRGMRPTVAIDVLSAEMYPQLVDYLREAGSEFVAHGLSVTRPITGAMDLAQERDYIAQTLERLQACGITPAGWFGPEYGESTRTPQLLGEAGLGYVCDWANDEQPYAMTTPGDLVALPLWADFDDQTVLVNRMCNLDMFEDHLRKALTQLHSDGLVTARLLHYCVRPWVSGAPLRIAMFERVLDHLLSLGGVWTPTGGEVVAAWRAARTRESHD
ncbi:MAG: polysaccharide deacetylase family protein [Rhodoferax sp.]|nr:polysaccharide deacetylase family protein [Rhodoferax sp.]